jgi:hypothetical protein
MCQLEDRGELTLAQAPFGAGISECSTSPSQAGAAWCGDPADSGAVLAAVGAIYPSLFGRLIGSLGTGTVGLNGRDSVVMVRGPSTRTRAELLPRFRGRADSPARIFSGGVDP